MEGRPEDLPPELLQQKPKTALHLRGLRKDDIKQVQPIQTQEKQCMQ